MKNERYRDLEREIETQRERQEDILYKWRDQRDRLRKRQIDGQKAIDTNREMDIERWRYRDRGQERDRQTDIQKARDTDGVIDR